MEKNVALGCLLDYYGAFLTQRQRSLLELHVNEDYSLSEIAQIADISRQGVHDALKRGEEQLLEMEKQLGLHQKTKSSLEAMDQLRMMIDALHVPEQERARLLEGIDAIKRIWE